MAGVRVDPYRDRRLGEGDRRVVVAERRPGQSCDLANELGEIHGAGSRDGRVREIDEPVDDALQTRDFPLGDLEELEFRMAAWELRLKDLETAQRFRRGDC